MRTALILLFLLAVGAIPGSILPQNSVSSGQVSDYIAEHPELGPWLDRLYLFDVYSSPWYAAIYLLLFVSLTGCVLPRAKAHYRAMRARPPKTPRHLSRLPYSATFTTAAAPETVLQRARAHLKGYRADTSPAEPGGQTAAGGSVAAEKGYLRETGNVLFHLALLALLIALGAGSFLGYRGNMLVVEGDGFANTVPSYDAFYPGSSVDAADLQPFSFTVDDFQATFIEEGRLTGQAQSYSADLTYRASPESPERSHHLQVNHPLPVNGAQVYLLGHGYAPNFRVTDAEGQVVFDQAVPFLNRGESNFTSDGVIKVPDIGPEQLGFRAVFLPSAATADNGDLVSDFPGPRNPTVTLEAYQGDLGLDSGQPQSVYQLYTQQMEQIDSSESLQPGDTWELPDGSSITFTGVSDYISMQVTSNPARLPALLSAAVAVLGLLCTLFVQPRRVWVRARAGGDGTTTVEVGGLAKTDTPATNADFHEFTLRLSDDLRERAAPEQGSEKE
ncbi:cytochrome c biogenesis protein ResB [Salinactinospora qingdaonensis]|uniref:Cytochrome c biogenesis protein ResB n=2 Tax=Salinactinospora qingdaonensis TaxID=702744 RepID=A0ABP7FZD8_9ACTN